jgi:hypothetical protein
MDQAYSGGESFKHFLVIFSLPAPELEAGLCTLNLVMTRGVYYRSTTVLQAMMAKVNRWACQQTRLEMDQAYSGGESFKHFIVIFSLPAPELDDGL